MTTDIAIQIIELALSLVKGSNDAAIAAALAQIIGKAWRAYEAHTGQPLDPSVIKAENPI